jgi:hypothetical protein
MRAFEWLVLVYAAVFGLRGAARPRAARSAPAVGLSLLTAACVALVHGMRGPLPLIVPGLYLIAGYWLPALVVGKRADAGAPRFESWLSQTDTWLRPRLPRVPASLVALTETAYLLCYPIVPLSLAIVWWIDGADAVPRFWTTVLVAGFACYASLPWLLSRPPGRSGLQTLTLRTVNRSVLATVSHQWTTFPSGHVAVAWAAAFAVARASVAAGAVFAVVALGVTVGAAAGRYHYVIDVLLGMIVALVALVIT